MAHPVIPLSRLAVLEDDVCLRDPCGQGLRPSLVPVAGGLAVRGPFTVLQRFEIAPEEGHAFVEATGDANPIHVQDTIVSGAMTAARLLVLPEVMLPRLAVRSVRLKFRAFSRYGRATVNRFQFRPERDGSIAVDAAVFQGGTLVADGVIKAGLAPPSGAARLAAVSCESLATMRSWLSSLRLDPDRALEALDRGYPRAFLASLPSAEMVRQGGSGGLLNVLDLEFPEEGLPALESSTPPTVEVETQRPRSSFRRVLARVGSGMVTYCRGYATVLFGWLQGGTSTAPTSA